MQQVGAAIAVLGRLLGERPLPSWPCTLCWGTAVSPLEHCLWGQGDGAECPMPGGEGSALGRASWAGELGLVV